MKRIFTLLLLAFIGVANLNAQTYSSYATVATPAGLVFDGTGNLYVAQYAASGNIIKVNTSGVVTTFTQSTIIFPTSIVSDGSGNLYVNRSNLGVLIQKVNSAGIVSTYVGGGGSQNWGIARDVSSNFYVLRSGASGAINKISPSITLTTFVTGLNAPNTFGSLAFDAAGDLYVAYNSIVYKITPAGVVSTLATLSVSNINSLAIDATGNIFLGGSFSGIYKVTPTGTVSAVAGLNSLSNIYGLAFDASGNLYASGYSTNTIYKIDFCTPTTFTNTQAACDSFYWADKNKCSYTWAAKGNKVYTASNNTDTIHLTNVGACDSLVTLDLTINQPTTGTFTTSACDSFYWADKNKWYFANNNTDTVHLTNLGGCDSLVTLDLTITQPTSSIFTISSCNSYIWAAKGNKVYTASNSTDTIHLTNSGR
ncbi:MAG: hypothetical protein NTZ59_04895 [Bacteroidetes bacterium]|nr:hypothetical protein [Bacteroidota bacterium]